jgi:hypothetical protein
MARTLLPRPRPPLATTQETFEVGDPVELKDAVLDTIGTVVALMREGHVKVEWHTGEGYIGKTTMLSVRVLRKRPE